MPYIGPNTRSRVDSRRRLIFLLCALGDRLPSGIRKCFNINMIAVKFAVASVHIFMAWLFVVPARRLYAQCRSDGRLFFLFCFVVLYTKNRKQSDGIMPKIRNKKQQKHSRNALFEIMTLCCVLCIIYCYSVHKKKTEQKNCSSSSSSLN